MYEQKFKKFNKKEKEMKIIEKRQLILNDENVTKMQKIEKIVRNTKFGK